MTPTLDNEYFITYSNYFKIENRTFAFKNKVLFDITETPKYLELKDNNGSLGYWINKRWYSLTKIKPLIIQKTIVVDVSHLQWYEQLNLNFLFSL